MSRERDVPLDDRNVRHADVAVVGGGPAGSTAATLLAREGHDVVLLERDHHPRHQIGESLLPTTVHGACRLTGVWDDLHQAGFVRKRGGTWRWGMRADPVTIPLWTYSFQVERARFDALLFENARRHGVDARQGLDALELMRDGDRAVGVLARDERGELLEVRATYVVDASGHQSRLARTVGKRIYSEHFRNVAVYGYFHGAGRLPAPDTGNIQVEAFEHGWCWYIPLSDELTSVGAVVDHRHARRIADGRESALTSFLEECPMLREQLSSAQRVTDGIYGQIRIRKDWSYTTDRLTAPGVMLVGDAACFIDPLLSSGVHLATHAAVLAARSINTAFSGDVDEAACIREFERRCRREFTVWYDFLVAFSDRQQDWNSYFWAARSILQSPDRNNDAFIRLISEGGTRPEDFGASAEDYFIRRAGMGAACEAMMDEVIAHPLPVPPGLDSTAPPEPPPPVPVPSPQSEAASSGPVWILNDVMSERQRVAREVTMFEAEHAPTVPDGLIPTPDGLRWMHPESTDQRINVVHASDG
jgi:halogenation protein CepH